MNETSKQAAATVIKSVSMTAEQWTQISAILQKNHATFSKFCRAALLEKLDADSPG